jgi:hypothetical protein
MCISNANLDSFELKALLVNNGGLIRLGFSSAQHHVRSCQTLLELPEVCFELPASELLSVNSCIGRESSFQQRGGSFVRQLAEEC